MDVPECVIVNNDAAKQEVEGPGAKEEQQTDLQKTIPDRIQNIEMYNENPTPVMEALQSDDLCISDGLQDLARPVKPRRKRAQPVASACGQCQKRKTKCSAQRPVCSYCDKRGLSCSWDVSDGLTRYEDLRQKVRAAELRLNHLCILIEAMRTVDDDTSTMLLARLRLGESVNELVRLISPTLDD